MQLEEDDYYIVKTVMGRMYKLRKDTTNTVFF